MPMSVIQHVLSRLHDLGITDVFGVPGDFSFPLNGALCTESGLRWIGCCNEINAAYAAEGYARVKGAGAVCTTSGSLVVNVADGNGRALADDGRETTHLVHWTVRLRMQLLSRAIEIVR
jgi:indolepyruvate decarboxylase